MIQAHTVRNAAQIAADSIVAHKLRSVLTLLGVIAGVASVVLVGAAIDGLGVYAERSIAKAFGADSFLVAQIAQVGDVSRREYLNKLKHNKPIREDDARFVEATAGDKVFYSPSLQRGGIDVKRENLICEGAWLLGASAAMADIRDIVLSDGRFFTEQEERAASKVAVIGDEVRATLFPDGSSALHEILRLDGVEFTVVGVQEKLGSSFGRSQDKMISIPAPAFYRMYGQGNGFALFGRPKPGMGLSLTQAVDETRIALRARFHARPGDPDNFDTLTPDAILGFIKRVIGIIAAVVVPVTSLSLVVGGIVIMNIMLISVTERTSEIGLRKALGARYSDLMLQFLIESVALSVAGGAVGLGLGALLTALLSRWLEVPLAITAGYVVLALGVSIAVGICSGWYPAFRAARMDPVAALRAE